MFVRPAELDRCHISNPEEEAPEAMNPPPAEGLASRLLLVPALRTQPDRRLVTLVRDGYDAAFEEIVRRYGQRLRRYAAAIVGCRSEDVTQDAFSKALLAMRRKDDAGAHEIELRPWLYRIVRNTALNDLRDRPPESAELVEGVAAGARSAAEEAERREEMAELVERLRSLPEPQRAAIVMRELEGLGHGEIAAALGMSGGAARQAIFRARQALRDGVGLMIPMPALRMLFDHAADAGAAAGAGGAVAALGGAGAGTALKVGVLTAVLVGSVGTGLAIKDDHPADRSSEPAAAAASTDRGAAVGGDSSGSSSGRASAESGGGPGPEGLDDHGRGGSGRDDGAGNGGHGASGHGGRDDSMAAGQSPSSSPGGGGPGPGGHSGPGDGAAVVVGGSDGGPGPSGGANGGGGSPGPSGGGSGGSSGPGGGGDDGVSGDGGATPEGAPPPESAPPAELDTSGRDGGSGTSATSNSGPGSVSDDGGHSGPG
jgi:RNA polymerase sigma factor (sigma-70 family)